MGWGWYRLYLGQVTNTEDMLPYFKEIEYDYDNLLRNKDVYVNCG